MKEQMEEEKAVIDRERAIAEGRDAEIKEEEVSSSCVASPLVLLTCVRYSACEQGGASGPCTAIRITSCSRYACLLSQSAELSHPYAFAIVELTVQALEIVIACFWMLMVACIILRECMDMR